eukprot:TRINITY_DN1252_c0_g1_i1.p2 TRINITY_DN1252_c0_g1~~TRINITY_DN1252_c0_g1_i1.p2  ORF type:complete len:274 (+),score=119.67 TRINITY_DN1252_c0_g1_i1:80-901(+)
MPAAAPPAPPIAAPSGKPPAGSPAPSPSRWAEGGGWQPGRAADERWEGPDLSRRPAPLPLNRRWVFWLHRGVNHAVPTGPEAELVRHVAAVDSVGAFWAVYQHMKHPSDVPPGTAYLLFDEGVAPMASRLPGAGRFVLRLHKGDAATCVWEDVLLRSIGEQWEPAHEVLGVAVSVLPEEDVVEVWSRNAVWLDALAHLQDQLCSMPPPAAVISAVYQPFDGPPIVPQLHPLPQQLLLQQQQQQQPRGPPRQQQQQQQSEQAWPRQHHRRQWEG